MNTLESDWYAKVPEPARVTSDPLDAALGWCRTIAPFESHEIVTKRPWATTVRLNGISGFLYLKIVPGMSAQTISGLTGISRVLHSETPSLIASDAEDGWLLYENHGGVELERKQSDGQKQDILNAYGRLQVRASKARDQLTALDLCSADEAFDQLIAFLKNDQTAPSLDGSVGGSFFLGRDKADRYCETFEAHRDGFIAFLARARELPPVLEHCDLRPPNMARRGNGGLVFFDWDEAVLAPPGFSLHALFSGCSRIFRALDRADEPSLSADEREQTVNDRQTLAAYAEPLVNVGIGSRDALRAALPASAAAGVIHYIRSFGNYADVSDTLRKSVARNITRRLDDLVFLTEMLEPTAPKGEPKQVEREQRPAAPAVVAPAFDPQDAPDRVPTITFSEQEQDEARPREETIEEAVFLFKRHGTLLFENAVPVDLIDTAHDRFIERYDRYLTGKRQDDALRVGDKRFMITLDFEAPYSDPRFFASRLTQPIMRKLLGKELILGSLTCVASLPGSADQRLHKDHAALFKDDPDLVLPSFAITTIVPLVDLNEVTGATRLIKGSHRVSSEEAKSMPYQDPVIDRGSCFLMDFRLSHQGMANRSERPRPIASVVYQRPWFRDYLNYQQQKPLELAGFDLDTLSSKERALVEWASHE
ncbi:MAG: phytanoyl-CoA dioxygenase family protein [Pseudomonadota bacterium]